MSTMRKIGTLCMFLGIVVFQSCTKDSTTTIIPKVTSGIDLSISHQISNSPLLYDTLMYTNAAGNKYSVTRLYYYISRIRVYTTSGDYYTSDSVFYIDAANGSNVLHVKGIPVGTYSGIDFLIGLDTTHNRTGFLPDIYTNLNMAWPPDMGGGYHFLKLEGHYLDASQIEKGFTMHLGTDAMVVAHNKLVKSYTVAENVNTTLSLQMNVNEWFSQPYNYNFLTDGNYTMGNVSLMQLIRNNGQDVFTIQ